MVCVHVVCLHLFVGLIIYHLRRIDHYNIEAGYSLQRKDFFDNIGAITLYAMIGTLISTFVVGFLTFYAGRIGVFKGIDTENPLESLLFGALISAVDPVATLSIMGSPELQCNR